MRKIVAGSAISPAASRSPPRMGDSGAGTSGQEGVPA